MIIYSHTDQLSHRKLTLLPPALPANGNDSKKFKGDIRGGSSLSRVLHIRKLPADVTEAEVIALGQPFGDVTNLLLLKAKNQVNAIQPSSLGAVTTLVDLVLPVPLRPSWR